MRQYLGIIVAFTVGALFATVVAERKLADERDMSAYLQGKLDAVYDATHQIEEDSPEWDCHTMGNRKCGP